MRRWLVLLVCLVIITASCSPGPPDDWKELIPDRTPFLIIPDGGSSLAEILNAPYMPLFEDISSSAIHLTGELAESSGQNIPLKAILIYPDTASEWQPVWITGSQPGLVETLKARYQRPFTQNQYSFKRYKIEILSISNRSIFVSEIGPHTVISESSRAIEDMIRASNGSLPRMVLSEETTKPDSYLVNTPNLERWVEQLTQVTYRPYLTDLFKGSEPVSMRYQPNGSETLLWSLQGKMNAAEETSNLVRSISSPASQLQLDRYISTNIAAFSIFRLEPRSLPPQDLEPESELDHYLAENHILYRNLSSALGHETAFAAYAESGFMSSSEFLFIRWAEDPASLREVLDQLAADEKVQKEGRTYHLHSRWLGNLIGSDLSPFSSFYLFIHQNGVAISRSRSLVEGVGNDFDRRAVLYYDEGYSEIRQNLPDELSSLTYVNTPEFNSYVQPWLDPQNYFGSLSSSLEILTIATARADDNSPIHLSVSSHSREETDAPYRARWVFPFQSNLAGAPILANLTGNSRDEIIFTTEDGTIYALAADGTEVMRTYTSSDRPVGPPVVYDWYGNNQQVIMQAAGNKIYAWNEAGSLLPNFPVELSEEITTPLQIEDVTRNGVPEMIVATADRNVHILNSRGDNISGWPQTANSVIRSAPKITLLGDQRTLFAFAENGLHGWNISGSRRSGFPVFIESQFNGSPVFFENHILGAASDGNLYATGVGALFDDALAASSQGDSLVTQALNVSNSSLNQTPFISNEMLRVDGELVRENLILVQSSNGSVLAFNTNGELRFTQNMGQTGSGSTPPMIMDINNNSRRDVVSLADVGRLYAWDLISGERHTELPASGMRYPKLQDLNNDGNIEVIAQTREGLRIWSIFR